MDSPADNALEQVIQSMASTTPTAQSIGIDINRDGSDDYEVGVAQPQCIRVSLATAVAPSSLTLEGMSSSTWNTEWELLASVQDPSTGAAVRVRSGIRLLADRSCTPSRARTRARARAFDRTRASIQV